jgi:hypothetical protein
MKTNYLFPNRLKVIGWMVFIPAFILGAIAVTQEWEPEWMSFTVPALFPGNSWGLRGESSTLIGMVKNNILNEILGFLMIASGIVVAFSKEKDEDEMVGQLRVRALVWACYWNYAILTLSLILVYDIAFYWIMVFNMFTILVFFIAKFNWSLLQMRKTLGHEE